MATHFNAAFDLARTAVPKWQQSLGWNESYSRRIRLITGILGLALLFAGIVMQWLGFMHICQLFISKLSIRDILAFCGYPGFLTKREVQVGRKQYLRRFSWNCLSGNYVLANKQVLRATSLMVLDRHFPGTQRS